MGLCFGGVLFEGDPETPRLLIPLSTSSPQISHSHLLLTRGALEENPWLGLYFPNVALGIPEPKAGLYAPQTQAHFIELKKSWSPFS